MHVQHRHIQPSGRLLCMSEPHLCPVRSSADSDMSFVSLPTPVGVCGLQTALLFTLECMIYINSVHCIPRLTIPLDIQRTFHLELPYRIGLTRMSQYVSLLATILLVLKP